MKAERVCQTASSGGRRGGPLDGFADGFVDGFVDGLRDRRLLLVSGHR
jgi:hypothetical protein